MIRLLPKYEIDKRKAEERKQQIDEGMRIAERVDTLRETAVSEETAFEQYRIETLSKVQSEINALIQERDLLIANIEKKRNEWNELLEPLDKNWKRYVEGEKQRIDGQVAQNALLEKELQTKTNTLQKKIAEYQGLLKETETTKAHYEQLVAQSKDKEAQAIETLAQARNQAQKIVSTAEVKMTDAEKRLNQAIDYEHHLSLKEAALQKKEEELEDREMKALALELQYYSPVKKN